MEPRPLPARSAAKLPYARPLPRRSVATLPPRPRNTSADELPSGWMEYHDSAGKPYYHNAEKGETVWVKPTAPDPKSPTEVSNRSKTGQEGGTLRARPLPKGMWSPPDEGAGEQTDVNPLDLPAKPQSAAPSADAPSHQGGATSGSTTEPPPLPKMSSEPVKGQPDVKQSTETSAAVREESFFGGLQPPSLKSLRAAVVKGVQTVTGGLQAVVPGKTPPPLGLGTLHVTVLGATNLMPDESRGPYVAVDMYGARTTRLGQTGIARSAINPCWTERNSFETIVFRRDSNVNASLYYEQLLSSNLCGRISISLEEAIFKPKAFGRTVEITAPLVRLSPLSVSGHAPIEVSALDLLNLAPAP